MARKKRKFIPTFVRLDQDDHRELAQIAQKEHRSFAAQIRHVLSNFVKVNRERRGGASNEQQTAA